MSDQTLAPPPPSSGPSVKTDAEMAKKRKDRVEFIAAVLIGFAAVLTAVATFQGNEIDGDERRGQNEALRLTVVANDAYSNSDSERANERDLFFRAVTETDQETRDFLFGAMPEEMLSLVDEWYETDDAVLNPFSGEADYAAIEGLYSTQFLIEGNAIEDKANCVAFGAAVADSQGENYGLATVILSIALVVAGIAALLTSKVPQIMVLTISTLSLVFGGGLLLFAADEAEARTSLVPEFFVSDDQGELLSVEESFAAAEKCAQP